MTDVEHLAHGARMLHERDHRIDHVAHPRERAPLLPVAIHGYRLVLERLRDEARHDHPVLARLARPDGIEQAHDGHGQRLLVRVGEREMLVHDLRRRIAPARLRGRAEHQVVAFGERGAVELAVHLGGRGHEHRAAPPGGKLEQQLAGADVGGDRLDRLVHDETHAHRRGQVEHHVGLGHERCHDRPIERRVDGEREMRVGPEREDVLEPARGEVVEHVDPPPGVEQGARQVRADKARPARDQRAARGHEVSPPAAAALDPATRRGPCPLEP